MGDAIIRIDNISKIYLSNGAPQKNAGESNRSGSVLALDNISFNVCEGEILSLIGSNGSGKTTLLSILSGIIKPSKGKAIITGNVASILQLGSNFVPDISGRDNVRLNYSKEDHHSPDEFARTVMEFSGLKNAFEMPVKYYSNGMFLRLAFSTIFLKDADIYLIDEVLNVGDEEFRLKINHAFKKLIDKNKTIMLATHDKQETMAICSRCIWIEQGKIIRDDKPQKVMLEYAKFQRLKFETELFGQDNAGENTILYPEEAQDNNILFFKEGEYSNEYLEFKTIEISGTAAPYIYREEEINVKVRLLKKTRNTTLSMQVKIRNEFSQPVLFSVSLFNAGHKNYDRDFADYLGMLEYRCVIPKEFLASGKYFVSIYFGKNNNQDNPLYNERAFHFPKEICFNVRSKTTEFISEPVHYSVHPAFEWKIQSV